MEIVKKKEYTLRRVTTKKPIPRKFGTYEEAANLRESRESPGRWEVVSRDVVVCYGEWELAKD